MRHRVFRVAYRATYPATYPAVGLAAVVAVAGCAGSKPEVTSSISAPGSSTTIRLADLDSPYVDQQGTTWVAQYVVVKTSTASGRRRWVVTGASPSLKSQTVSGIKRTLRLLPSAPPEADRSPKSVAVASQPMEDYPAWVTAGSGAYFTREGAQVLVGVGAKGGIKQPELALAAARSSAAAELHRVIQTILASMSKDYSSSVATGDLSGPTTNEQMVEQAIRTFALSSGASLKARGRASANSTTVLGLMAPKMSSESETYARIEESGFRYVSVAPLSTFSIDVDTASYANVRRFLGDGRLPPADAVRIEELVNYFDYQDPVPDAETPFSINVELAPSPWSKGRRLARIGLKTKPLSRPERVKSNLVFLIDVSGSMQRPNKLPLLQRAMRMLVRNLNPEDRVAVVVYAGASGLVLPSTRVAERQVIMDKIAALRAGGSTNGGAGIQLAYSVAQQNFIPDGINRIVLATDGDFNVGTTSRAELTRLIEEKAKTGVFLTVLGFGRGNYNDATLESLADHGNGNYGYVDRIEEARRLLVEQAGATLVTVAKDVKIQVEFNPARVGAYRLLGYENRRLDAEDFEDDTKDAGEIGAGHTVTALYELVPPEEMASLPAEPELKYRRPSAAAVDAYPEIMTVRVRYKEPTSDTSERIDVPIIDPGQRLTSASPHFRFAAAVAGFGMLLRDSPHKGDLTYPQVLDLAEAGLDEDPYGHRAEFVDLVRRAQALAGSASER